MTDKMIGLNKRGTKDTATNEVRRKGHTATNKMYKTWLGYSANL